VDNKNLRTTSNLSKSGLLHNREKERATDKRQDSAIVVLRITRLLSLLNECASCPTLEWIIIIIICNSDLEPLPILSAL